VLFATILVCPPDSYSQIQITSADMLSLKGTMQTTLQEVEESTPVDLGSPGANQTWDFRNKMIVDSLLTSNTYLDPSEAEGASFFPTANLVQRISTIPDSGFTLFAYYRVSDPYFVELGEYQVISSPFDTTFVTVDNDTVALFPLSYGDSWMTSRHDTSDTFGIVNINIDSSKYTVDAWGTVMIPLGSFQCLRLRQEEKNINKTIVQGIEIGSSTQTFIQYDWLSKGAFSVAWAQSQEGETNLNFTDALGFGRLEATSGTVSVESPTTTPETFSLQQNYPNPFNPETRIGFSLDERTEVDLSVFNTIGQKVRTLAHGSYEAGSHEVTWNGTDDSWRMQSAGLYFYRLTSNGEIITRKMVLVQ
jgi:hypothetical protein